MFTRALSATTLLLVFACGGTDQNNDKTDKITQVMGPEGGTLETADKKLTLFIPQGALTEPTEIEIAAAPAPSVPADGPQPIPGTTYEFLPHGLVFANGIPEVTIRFDPAQIPEEQDILIGKFLEDGTFAADPTIEITDNTIRAELNGFSQHGATSYKSLIGGCHPLMEAGPSVDMRGASNYKAKLTWASTERTRYLGRRIGFDWVEFQRAVVSVNEEPPRTPWDDSNDVWESLPHLERYHPAVVVEDPVPPSDDVFIFYRMRARVALNSGRLCETAPSRGRMLRVLAVTNAPTAPLTFQAEPGSRAGEIKLSWPRSDTAEEYIIERQTIVKSDSDFEPVATLGYNDLFFADKNLNVGTEYRYRLTASNRIGAAEAITTASYPAEVDAPVGSCRIVAIIDEEEATPEDLSSLREGSMVVLEPRECGDPDLVDFTWSVGSSEENTPFQQAERLALQVSNTLYVRMQVLDGGRVIDDADITLTVSDPNNQQPTTDIYSMIEFDPGGSVSIQRRLRIEIHALIGEGTEARFVRMMDVYPDLVDHVIWTLHALDPATALPTEVILDRVRDNDDMLVYDRGSHLEPGMYGVEAEVYDATGALVTKTHNAAFFVTE